MLISFSKNRNEGFDRHYIEARRKIDILCGLITSGRLPKKNADALYNEIENDFARIDKDSLELFRMIYENRVKRLCDQFCPKNDHEK